MWWETVALVGRNPHLNLALTFYPIIWENDLIYMNLRILNLKIETTNLSAICIKSIVFFYLK